MIIEMITDKIQTLDAEIQAKEAAEKSVGRDKLRVKALKVIEYLLPYADENDLPADIEDMLFSLMEKKPAKKAGVIIQVKEGDNIVMLLEKYSGVNNIAAKLTKQADLKGLKLDSTGCFVQK